MTLRESEGLVTMEMVLARVSRGGVFELEFPPPDWDLRWVSLGKGGQTVISSVPLPQPKCETRLMKRLKFVQEGA